MALFRKPFVNIFKSTFRLCSVQANPINIQNEETSQHIYRKTLSKSELIDHLSKSINYNKDGIVVCDKPYGISVYKEAKNVHKNYQPRTFETLSLEEVIDELAEKLGFKQLKVNRAPERFCSGVLILTRGEKSDKKVLKYYRRSEGRAIPYSYLVVTQFQPNKLKNKNTYGLMLEDPSDKRSNHLAEKWSHSSQKRNETNVITIGHKVLCSSNVASLVKVDLTRNLKNALRLYMATKCLSPILGDDRYCQRIVKMDDLPMDLGSKNPQSRNHFRLPPEYLIALQLGEKESMVVPVHQHLQSFLFPSKDLQDLVLKIPPPEWFIWSCEQLNLDIRKVLRLDVKNENSENKEQ